MTPIVQQLKDHNSNFFYNGSSAGIMVLMRREAKLQGLNSVKVWACNQGCYDQSLIDQGGADVEGTNVLTTTLPFYSDYTATPMLTGVAKELGGPNKMNGNAVNALTAALLFQDAAKKATASGATLTRQSLLDALKAEHAFTAQGIIGPTDVGNRQPTHCIVMSQVKNGKWVRVHPTKVGTFDCSPKNTAKTASASVLPWTWAMPQSSRMIVTFAT
jgi:ABC-type branched-subunit amino acid transport system substrate-binding protein